MKQCTYCGKEYPNEAVICPVDGRPLREINPAPAAALPLPPVEPQQIIDNEHIKLLSVFHFVLAGFAFLGILFLLVHYLIMSTVFLNPDFWKSQKAPPPMPPGFFKAFVWFYLFMGTMLAAAGVLNILSGLFLRQRRHRMFSLVVAGIDCVQIPFGTVLGIFTLMVLMRDSVRRSYVA